METSSVDPAVQQLLDRMVESRQLSSMADHLVEKLKATGYGHVPVEGQEHGDWVLVDAGDVVVHLFRPEVRALYNLEKMWDAMLPELGRAVGA